MPGIGVEIGIIFVLVVLNGALAAAEMALVSARRGALQGQAEAGDEGARAALALIAAPNNFLATVQVGITLVGTAASAFGGASIARALAEWLRALGVPALARSAASLSLFLVVVAIAFLSLVVGELVPKRLALRNPDGWARRVALPMQRLSRLVHPLVRLLGVSTDFVLRLLGSREGGETAATAEEIGYLLETGMRQGEIRPMEAEIVQEVFRLTETRARDAMTPRPDIVALPDTAAWQEVLATIQDSGYSRIPIYRGSIDHIQGYVHARDLLGVACGAPPPSLDEVMHRPLFVPEAMTVADLLTRFRHERAHLAVVLDEFGATAGLITLEDVLEELVGEIEEEHRPEEVSVLQRTEDSWLVDGTVSLEDLRETFDVSEWPDRDRLGYTTLAGFVLATLGHIPRRGEAVEWQNYRFEVIDMDGRRIDQVLVTRRPTS